MTKKTKTEKDAIQELFRGTDGVSAIIAAIGDGISIQDADFKILYQNRALVDLIGYHVGEFCYRAYQRKESVCEGCPVEMTFRDGRVHKTENPGITDRGTIYAEITASPIRDKNGKVVAAIEVARDVTYRRRMAERLRILSITDELTDLYNRRGFFTLAKQQLKIAGRQKKRMILLCADIDHLKNINDTFGHQEGDLVLVEVSHILRESFRESDIIARIGGDEFVVLQGETTDAGPEILTARLRKTLERHNSRRNRSYELSISIGTACYNPASTCSIDELLVQADALMYEQKKLKKKIAE